MGKRPNIYIIANSVVSAESMSGGDRIFIEWSKRWLSWGYRVRLLVCREGGELCKANGVNGNYYIISRSGIGRLGVIPSYILRTVEALILLKPKKEDCIIYSSSDFLTDVLPALSLKMRNKRAIWAAGLYLISPNPFKGEARASLRSIAYYLSQRLAILFMKKYADVVFVLNSHDKKLLENYGLTPKKVKVVSGGVDLKYVSSIKPLAGRSYDACFIGRFHQQKGLPDLISIWEQVCEKKREAKLAVIGWGEPRWSSWLAHEVSRKKLKDNIDLLGFLDGEAKFKVLKSSKLFLLTSHRESWALVVCESMACGLPVIAYDLPVLREIYRKGMIMIPMGDIKSFANAVLTLLEDDNLYMKLKEEALEIASKYDWNKTAKKTLKYLLKVFTSSTTSS